MANILVDRSGDNRIVLGPGANRFISTTQVEEAFRAGPAPSLVLSQVAIATGARPDDAVRLAIAAASDSVTRRRTQTSYARGADLERIVRRASGSPRPPAARRQR